MTRQQTTLLGIFALFLAPVLLVLLMRSSWWSYQPEGLGNHGHLLQPPVALLVNPKQQDGNGLQAVDIAGKWLLLYVMPKNCDRRCTDSIISLRQVHKAAGRQGQHLAIVVLNQSPVDSELKSRIESISQVVKLVTEVPAEVLTTLAGINSDLVGVSGQDRDIHTYVVDPMLNVVLAYGADANPSGIRKDLKRLLKWSVQDKAS